MTYEELEDFTRSMSKPIDLHGAMTSFTQSIVTDVSEDGVVNAVIFDGDDGAMVISYAPDGMLIRQVGGYLEVDGPFLINALDAISELAYEAFDEFEDELESDYE